MQIDASTGTSPTAVPDLAPDDTFDALAALAAEAAVVVEAKIITVPIPARPRIRLRCVCDVDSAKMRDWRKGAITNQGAAARTRAAKANKPWQPQDGDVDVKIMAASTLVAQCRSIEMQRPDGEWVTVLDSNGVAVDPFHTLFETAITKVADRRMGMVALFGDREPDIARAAEAIMEGSGYAEETDLDPL